MGFDIRTIISVLGVTHLLQVLVLFYQYRFNKTYAGTGWWLWWSILGILGFSFMSLRDIPSLRYFAIIAQNGMIIAGVLCVYIGVLRFLDKRENRRLIISLYVVFLIALIYLNYGYNNVFLRSVIICTLLAAISFATAYALLMYKLPSIRASANFLSVVFVIHGVVFAHRTVMVLAGTPVDNYFVPTWFNFLPYLDGLIVGLLWTIGFIMMLNQRLTAEMAESKKHFEVVFATSPDATIITRLEDGVIVDINDGFSALTGYTRDDVIGKSSLDINVWQNVDDRRVVVAKIRAQGFCDNYEAVFLRKDKTRVIGLMSAKLIDLQGIPHILSVTRDISEVKRVDNARRESEERLEMAQHAAKTGVWDWDVITGNIIWSSHMYELFGLDPQKTVASFELWNSILYPEDKEIAGQRIAESLKDHTTLKSDYRVVLPDGQIRWINAIGQGKYDDQGHPVRMIGICMDITEHKQTQEVLAFLAQLSGSIAGEDFFAALARYLAENLKMDFVCIDRLEGDGLTAQTLAVWSDGKFEDNISYALKDTPCGEVVGKTVCCFPASVCQFFPRDAVLQDLKAESYVGVTLWSHSGKPIGLIAVISRHPLENRTHIEAIMKLVAVRAAGEMERLDAEAELKKSEQDYRTLFNEMMDGFALHEIICDAHGTPVDYRFLAINPAFERMTGLTEKNLIGRTVLEVFPHTEFQWIETYGKVALTGEPVFFENYSVDLKKYFEVTAYRPAPNQFACIFADITERKQAEAEKINLQNQLAQSQKMESIGRLAGGVAHDFNNMLQTILGYTEMSIQEVPPDSSLCENFLEIQKAGQRSAELTRQLLAFARKQPIAPFVLDLNDAVVGMLKMLTRLIGENINLVWIPGTIPWLVKMDPSQIDQILVNLSINARDSIAGKGKITIETDKVEFDDAYCSLHPDFIPGRFVLLTVSDDGCGMDENTIAHIFEPFYTTKEMGRGTGLGLSTIYGIIKQNQGFINVQSEPGKGTTFNIYFPAQENEFVKVEETLMSTGSPGGTETILLLEDEASLLQLVQQMLMKLGYRVLAAGSPGMAIEWMQEYKDTIHLLITDVVMPEMSGRELWSQVRLLRKNCKCLYMSGYTKDVIAHQGILEDGVHFIQKPFSTESLALKIREVLNQP